jgi:hypothetical protein
MLPGSASNAATLGMQGMQGMQGNGKSLMSQHRQCLVTRLKTIIILFLFLQEQLKGIIINARKLLSQHHRIAGNAGNAGNAGKR